MYRQDGAKLLVWHVAFLYTPMAHLCSAGIKSSMGGPWARTPRRGQSCTPLEPFLLYLCTLPYYVALPNKAPHLHRERPSCWTAEISLLARAGLNTLKMTLLGVHLHTILPLGEGKPHLDTPGEFAIEPQERDLSPISAITLNCSNSCLEVLLK